MPTHKDDTPFRALERMRPRDVERLRAPIKALWDSGKRRALRQERPFLYAHDCFRRLTEVAGPDVATKWYRQQVLTLSGIDGMSLFDGKQLSCLGISPLSLTVSQRQAVWAVVSELLDSAGLYDAQYPRENRHYRVLVAHLLLCPWEIDDARDLVPFPRPWFLLEEAGRCPSIQREKAIVQEQERLVDRLNGVLRNPTGKPPRAPYGLLSKTAKTGAQTARTPKSKQMHPARGRVASVACDLLNEDQTRTLDDVLENEDFKDAQRQEWHELRINARSTLSDLLAAYRKQTGRHILPRRKEKLSG